MPTKDKNKINQVLARGVAEVLPDKKTLTELMTQKKIKLYQGIDPTGSLLHLGHAVGLRKLQQFAELGHQVILLVGNGTVKIGDPTGKDKSRPMLSEEEIESNFQNWKQQASKILDFDMIEIRRNGDWLDDLTYVDMIKLLGKVTVQQLLERDMFQRRIKNEQPIFGHEIIYPLLQGYDSVAMDVDLEIGGTDQTFNMMMGRTLQKIYNNHQKWVLTVPLIEGTDGRKMSKSYNNYVALTDDAKEMYGKIMSVKDELITTYFTVLTDIPMAEIKQIKQAIAAGENPMQFKKGLAFNITTNLHNQTAAKKAQKYFEKTIQGDDLPTQIPMVAVRDNPIQILALLNLCQGKTSNSQLKRLCQQGAVRLMPQDEKLSDPYQEIEIEDEQVIKIGKRNYYQLQLS